MVDKELKKKRTTLEKEKALLDEFEPPLANQLKTNRIARTEKLNVLVAPDDEILSIAYLDIGKLTRTFFAYFQLVFRGVFASSFLSCRSRKFVSPLHGNFEILRSFGFFILAKYCDSFNKFNKYFLQSLDSNLFFREWIFYRMPIHKLKLNLFHVRPIPKREAIIDKLLR